MSRRPCPRLAGVAIGAALLTIAHSGDASAQGLKLLGYADVEWSLEQTGDADNAWHNHFDNHHFNLIGVGWITDNLLATAEVEYEHSGEELGFEYGFLAYTGFRGIRIAGGKFLIPFGRFNKDLHPTWINKLPAHPLPYDQIFPEGYSDAGLWVSGGLPIGSGSRFIYDAYVVNGLAGEPDEEVWEELKGNNLEGDAGSMKSVGARLGIELAQGLGIGASGYTGKYAEDLRISFLGGDIDYHWRELELRGEAVYGMQDRTTGDVSRFGFYLQGAYLLSSVSPTLANFEPAIRWSRVDFSDEDFDLYDVGLGLNFYVAASSSIRAFWFFVQGSDNDRLVTQWNIAF